MNDFSRIRHRIYLERSGDRCADHRTMVERLGHALFGDAPDAPVQMDVTAG